MYQSDFGCIRKIDSPGFADQFNVENERKGELGMALNVFCLSSQKNQVAIYFGGKVCRKSTWKIKSFAWVIINLKFLLDQKGQFYQKGDLNQAVM